ATSRRLLELQIARMALHLAFQTFDLALDLLGCGCRPKTRAHATALLAARRGLSALASALHDVFDGLHHATRRDAMLEVEGQLLLAPPGRLCQCALHRSCFPIGIENGAAIEIARRATDGLDQRTFGTQEAFLVGIENGHQ